MHRKLDMIPFMHIGIAFAFFTIIYFLTRHPLKLNDIIASLFLFFLALPMLIKMIDWNMGGASTDRLLLSIGSYPFLYGPFLYLYTRFEISEKPEFKKSYLLHFVPFVISVALIMLFPGMNQEARAVNLGKELGQSQQQNAGSAVSHKKPDEREMGPPPRPGEREMAPPPEFNGKRRPPPGPGRPGRGRPPKNESMARMSQLPPPPGHDGNRPPEGPGPGGPHSYHPAPPDHRETSIAATAVPGAITIAYFIAYTVMILAMLRKHKKNISEYFSYDSYKVNLKWLRWLTVCFFLAYVSVFLTFIIRPEIYSHPYLDPHMSPDIAIAFFIFAFSLFAVKQPVIFAVPDPEDNKNSGQEKPSGVKETGEGGSEDRNGRADGDEGRSELKERRYEKSGLKECDARSYLESLDRYMKDEKPYLDSELTILTVSERLGIPRHYLTQAINEYLNKNFFVYINEFRVNEAKSRMSDENYRDHTILRIAYDSGFNSKSGFNIIFKKHTGFTPTEYRNSQV